MNPRLYKIIQSVTEDNYLYEIVESCGQTGVRCRVYVSKNDIFDDALDLYDTSKYGYHFRKFLAHRYHEQISYKFESIVWCWPYDKFSFKIGKEMSKEHVDEKISHKKRKIKNFIRRLEINNLPKNLLKKIEDELY